MAKPDTRIQSDPVSKVSTPALEFSALLPLPEKLQDLTLNVGTSIYKVFEKPK